MRPHPAIAIERDSRLAFAHSSRNSASKQKSMLQQTELGRASAMVKRISNVKRRDIPQAAIHAWRRGDAEGLRAALHLPPWEFNPLPYGRAVGYGLLPAGGTDAHRHCDGGVVAED